MAVITPQIQKRQQTQQVPGNLEQQLRAIQQSFSNLQQRIATEGITGAGGQVLQAPTAPPAVPTAPVTPTTPTTPTTPVTPPTIQQRITGLVAPGQQELNLQTQLQNLIASRELGVQKVEEQPIATPFITGQEAAITKRAAVQAMPLQARLANLQAQRQAALDVATTELGFEEKKIEREAAAQKPFTLTPGQQRFEFNPLTGQFEQAAAVAPTAAKGTLTEAGGRRLLVNPTTGEVIKDLGTVTTAGANLDKLLTITEAEKLGLPIGTTLGEAIGAVPLKVKKASDEAEAKLVTIDDLIASLKGVDAEGNPVDKVSTGPLEESRRVIAERTGFLSQSQTQQDFNAMVAKIKAGALFEVGGKALTTAEIAILSPFLPDLGKQESVNLTNLELLKKEAETIFERFTTPAEAGGGASVFLQNPDTGEVREFTNLSDEDLQDALSQGFIQQ